MKLYDYRYSPNARKVRAFIAQLGIDCDIEQVDILNGASRTSEFRQLNPNGKVPVLLDGSLVLSESNAILVYLAEREGRLDWLPASPQGRAEVLRWMFWQTAHLSAPAAKLGFEIAVKPWLKGIPTDTDVAARLAEDLSPWLNVLESQLDGREGVCGPLTIADFAIAAWVELPAERNFLGGYSRISEWYARVEQLPGWKESASASPPGGANET